MMASLVNEVKMIDLMLTNRERATLLELINRTNDARLLRRAYALLWLDEGDSVAEISEQLNISRQSIYNWLVRFQKRDNLPLARRLCDAERSGRPVTVQGIIDPLIDSIIDADPRKFGYRSTIWTVPLLMSYLSKQHRLNASAQSVRLALARLDISWRRPRHHLALRSETWHQAKGG
jgi:transposase